MPDGFSVVADVVVAHASEMRAAGEHSWPAVAANLDSATLPEAAFGEPLALAGAAEQYATVREAYQRLAVRATTILTDVADRLNATVANYQELDAEHARTVPR